MNNEKAYENLETWNKKHTAKWIPAMAPYKVLSCLDFGNSYFDTTDIDSTQVAKDLSCWVIYEEKFFPHNEYKNSYSLQVQKRQLDIADRAGIPAFLVLTSRQNSEGIICGNPETGIDWDNYIGTISSLYQDGNLKAAKEALGNGLADIYSYSNVIAIIPNKTAKEHTYKNRRWKFYLTEYERSTTKITVDTLNYMLKSEFPGL